MAVFTAHRAITSLLLTAALRNSLSNLGHSGSMRGPTAARKSTSRWLIHPLLQAAQTFLVTNSFSPCAFRNSPSPASSRTPISISMPEICIRLRTTVEMMCSRLFPGLQQKTQTFIGQSQIFDDVFANEGCRFFAG